MNDKKSCTELKKVAVILAAAAVFLGIASFLTPPNEWLHDGEQDYTRIFTDYIIRPDTAPAWAECTNEEKEEWEAEHPQPEPENAE